MRFFVVLTNCKECASHPEGHGFVAVLSVAGTWGEGGGGLSDNLSLLPNDVGQSPKSELHSTDLHNTGNHVQAGTRSDTLSCKCAHQCESGLPLLTFLPEATWLRWIHKYNTYMRCISYKPRQTKETGLATETQTQTAPLVQSKKTVIDQNM